MSTSNGLDSPFQARFENTRIDQETYEKLNIKIESSGGVLESTLVQNGNEVTLTNCRVCYFPDSDIMPARPRQFASCKNADQTLQTLRSICEGFGLIRASIWAVVLHPLNPSKTDFLKNEEGKVKVWQNIDAAMNAARLTPNSGNVSDLAKITYASYQLDWQD